MRVRNSPVLGFGERSGFENRTSGAKKKRVPSYIGLCQVVECVGGKLLGWSWLGLNPHRRGSKMDGGEPRRWEVGFRKLLEISGWSSGIIF